MGRRRHQASRPASLDTSSSSSPHATPISSRSPSSAGLQSGATTPTRRKPSPSKQQVLEMLKDQPNEKKWRNWWTRTFWTLIMIGGFFLILAAGPFWVVTLVILVQTLVYKEVIAIAHVPSKERKLPWFRVLNWYFLFSTTYYLYGESLSHYFKQSVLVDAFLQPLATYHRFISFVLYTIGFVIFVGNLKKGHYKFQFAQFAWTHMALLLVIVQGHFTMNNILEGLIWFFLPASLVICNDIFAYICGFFWGKTPLIKLSPKKTVEGFMGGWLCTILWGILTTQVLLHFKYMLCPAKEFGQSVWTDVDCELNPVFIPQRFHLSPWLSALVSRLLFTTVKEVWIAPMQFHTVALACFASLIAPFGGFFASGVKRAFHIKDFGDSIPGHGGLTDRMDCQFLMGVFSYMYYQTFIKTYTLDVGTVLHTIVRGLSSEDQLELYRDLGVYLEGQELLGNS
ncbi:MAG: phosphatidate cytidylyltransferase [Piptocephalis tieghemiana]|nr:MAG: phosphatidate cytidylyltransferase [Piptocephalis tieghemiana]